MSFIYGLGDQVEISASGEHGKIIGRAEYLVDDNQYWLSYKTASGCAFERWWAERALEQYPNSD